MLLMLARWAATAKLPDLYQHQSVGLQINSTVSKFTLLGTQKKSSVQVHPFTTVQFKQLSGTQP